jgi:hypothetical protein
MEYETHYRLSFQFYGDKLVNHCHKVYEIWYSERKHTCLEVFTCNVLLCWKIQSFEFMLTADELRYYAHI